MQTLAAGGAAAYAAVARRRIGEAPECVHLAHQHRCVSTCSARKREVLLAGGSILLMGERSSAAGASGSPPSAPPQPSARPAGTRDTEPPASVDAREASSEDVESCDPTGGHRAGGQGSARRRLPRIPRVQLGPLVVSKVIRGCWQLDGQHRGDSSTDRTFGAAALEDLDRSFRSGVFAFDTADSYGPSETILGQYGRLYPPPDGRLPVVLTKLSFMGGTADVAAARQASAGRDTVEYRVRGSMARLGVSRLDLLQLHFDSFQALGNTWLDVAKRAEELRQRGLIRALGVTNFDVPHLLQLLDAGITPVSNQVSYSVLDRRPELFMASLCERRGIALLPYGVLAGGFLADAYLGLPANKAQLDTLSKAKYGLLLQQMGGWAFLQDMLGMLRRIARKHSTSVANVAARWVLQQRAVPAVILGARNATHLKDHRRLFGFELDDLDMLDIDAAYESVSHQPTGDCYAWERGAQW